MIERNAVLGELLYIGLVYEKGRCQSSGIRKYTYSKSLKKHISFLREIAICMQKEFEKEEDNFFLKKICYEIQCDNVLRKIYPANKAIDELNTNTFIITDCSNENKHQIINNFIIKLLEDVLLELEKGLKKDEEKISRLLFALHNLPRVYLNKESYTLYSLGQAKIGIEDALEYSKMSMNDGMMYIYRNFFGS